MIEKRDFRMREPKNRHTVDASEIWLTTWDGAKTL